MLNIEAVTKTLIILYISITNIAAVLSSGKQLSFRRRQQWLPKNQQ